MITVYLKWWTIISIALPYCLRFGISGSFLIWGVQFLVLALSGDDSEHRWKARVTPVSLGRFFNETWTTGVAKRWRKSPLKWFGKGVATKHGLSTHSLEGFFGSTRNVYTGNISSKLCVGTFREHSGRNIKKVNMNMLTKPRIRT